MRKLLTVVSVPLLTCSIAGASDIKDMFENGKVSGDLRSIYAGYNQKEAGVEDTYATAVGGHLKYELSELNGFSAAAAFTISHDVGVATKMAV